MKLCRYCNKYYLESEFGVALTTKKKVYRRHKCKSCYRETKRKLWQRYRQWINEYKKKQKCSRCGIANYRVLEFHHLRDKKFSISLSFYSHYGFDRIKREIEKCAVLCANCHRILHHKERKNKAV